MNPMLQYSGHPKSSALFYWRNTSQNADEKPYFASYFTVSPVELQDEEVIRTEKMSFPYPIMIHEPLPVQRIDRVIQEARERNATIVECGEATKRNIKAQMKKVFVEYINVFITYQLEMEHKKEIVLVSDIMPEFNLGLNEERPSEEAISDRIISIEELTKTIRSFLDIEVRDKKNLEGITGEIERLRLGEEYDFDRFLHIVRVPGKIAGKISELYIRQFHSIASRDRSQTEECRKDISSLFTLKKLGELQEEARLYVRDHEMSRASRVIEEIKRIKQSNPPFTNEEDLDRFCKDLTKEGSFYDRLTSRYIEKYFLVIDKRFLEAGEIHREICSMREREARE